MISALLTFFLVGLAAVVVISVALAVIGLIFGIISMVLGIVGFLLFKVAPIVLIGYLVLRFLAPRRQRLAPADQKWLDES